MEESGVPENRLYWINAYDAVNVPTDSEFVGDLAPSIVLAMGKMAARWCTDAGLKFEEVSNPQYWKRFHNGFPYPLTQILKEHYRD